MASLPGDTKDNGSTTNVLTTFVFKMLELSPALLILMYLLWRQDQTIGLLIEQCILPK